MQENAMERLKEQAKVKRESMDDNQKVYKIENLHRIPPLILTNYF